MKHHVVIERLKLFQHIIYFLFADLCVLLIREQKKIIALSFVYAENIIRNQLAADINSTVFFEIIISF